MVSKDGPKMIRLGIVLSGAAINEAACGLLGIWIWDEREHLS